jgi:hypothetical protein
MQKYKLFLDLQNIIAIFAKNMPHVQNSYSVDMDVA